MIQVGLQHSLRHTLVEFELSGLIIYPQVLHEADAQVLTQQLS